ncbi:non-specific serine/threonine protein kinase [Malassezia sp. CBS 17886]|nr:non-specific serine/threonine protein kinase [Malassezia sp. CBS 17886]
MEARSLAEAGGAVWAHVQDTLWAVLSCLRCGARGTDIDINGTTYEVVKLLGEGGFSLVYLVRDVPTGTPYALKRIRCQYAEAVRDALSEVEAMKRFRGANVIRVYDACVRQDADSGASTMLGNVPAHDEEGLRGGKVVDVLMPYFRNGNVQDAISMHAVQNTHFAEAHMLRLFLGACRAVESMHAYTLPHVSVTQAPPSDAKGEPGNATPLLFDADSVAESSMYPPSRMSIDEPLEPESTAYAHRDIKPANVMVADDGVTGVLMDFGSTIKAHVPIRSRRDAVAHQDLAAERSSMPYRAPELFDVRSDIVLDEKVDVWSLGCTLYAMAYLHSPFETLSTVEQGGSIAMAVLNGSYKFPDSDVYSPATREIIRRCLQRDPRARPAVRDVINDVEAALSECAA